MRMRDRRKKVLAVLFASSMLLTISVFQTIAEENGAVTKAETESEAAAKAEAESEAAAKAVTESEAAETITDKENETEWMTEIVTEALTEPATETVTEVMTEPATETVTEVMAEPVTETVTEQVTEIETEPLTEMITEALTEFLTETTVEMETEEEPEEEKEKPNKSMYLVSNFPANAQMGDVISLRCVTNGYEEGSYTLQWQYREKDWFGNFVGEWTNEPGENSSQLEITIDEISVLCAWRVVLDEK